MVLGFVGVGVRVKRIRWVRRALKCVSWVVIAPLVGGGGEG